MKAAEGGIARAVVKDLSCRFELTFDRYMRLSQSAKALQEQSLYGSGLSILDVGGADGALALFMPDCDLDVIDPATTGGDVFKVGASSYDVVFAVDVIEHVEPRQRSVFLTQLARISRRVCILNYPIPQSCTTQKLVAGLTDDPFVGEHVKYGLPYSSTVERQLSECGFQCTTRQHTSRAVWAVYMALRANAAAPAQVVSRYLIEEHALDQVPDPLYETLIALRA